MSFALSARILFRSALGLGVGCLMAAAQDFSEGAAISEADTLRAEIAKLRKQLTPV